MDVGESVRVGGRARRGRRPGDRPIQADFGDPVATIHAVVPRAPTHAAPPVTAASVPPPPAQAMAVTLIIPSLRVRADVTPVDARQGRLAVPADPATVGWWAGSVLPGSGRGTVVLDGHVDEAGIGPGALFALTKLRAGDRIVLATDDHREVDYTVTARRVYPKAPGLPKPWFSMTGPARLELITCGGPFDATTRSYRDNIAVFATPATH